MEPKSCERCKYRHKSWLSNQFDKCSHPEILKYRVENGYGKSWGFCDLESLLMSYTCTKERKYFEPAYWRRKIWNFFF